MSTVAEVISEQKLMDRDASWRCEGKMRNVGGRMEDHVERLNYAVVSSWAVTRGHKRNFGSWGRVFVVSWCIDQYWW